mmetsp:Transcript_24353/g.47161  ORF Transcript_24353/g.47161 Transcript_24353/m.47161 type:complete len:305 (+) Transcript_24353:778-1692(+)
MGSIASIPLCQEKSNFFPSIIALFLIPRRDYRCHIGIIAIFICIGMLWRKRRRRRHDPRQSRPPKQCAFLFGRPRLLLVNPSKNSRRNVGVVSGDTQGRQGRGGRGGNDPLRRSCEIRDFRGSGIVVSQNHFENAVHILQRPRLHPAHPLIRILPTAPMLQSLFLFRRNHGQDAHQELRTSGEHHRVIRFLPLPFVNGLRDREGSANVNGRVECAVGHVIRRDSADPVASAATAEQAEGIASFVDVATAVRGGEVVEEKIPFSFEEVLAQEGGAGVVELDGGCFSVSTSVVVAQHDLYFLGWDQ